MSDEFNSAGCAPSDCASCTSNCSSNPNNQEPGRITLTLDDDTEVNCAILTVFPVEDKEYIALLPLNDDGQNHDGEVYLYAFSRTEDGDPILANIEEDEEYVKAAEAFSEVVRNARKEEEAGQPLE